MGKQIPFIIAGIFFVLTEVIYAQDNTQITVLLGIIHNNTSKSSLDGLSAAIHNQISTSMVPIRTVPDTFFVADSVPDQDVFSSARNLNAAYIIWGSADTLAGECLINLHAQAVISGEITHFRILLEYNESKGAVVSALVSKLQFWLERTLMAHITVMTQPPAVTLYLDGVPLGTTPFEGMVQPGNYNLEMKKNPLLPLHLPVTFSSGNSYHYDFTLTGSGHEVNRRSTLRLLAGASLCFAAGTGAAFMRSHSIDTYNKATPPSDFDHLYANATIWNITTITLFSAGGVVLIGSIFKAVF